MNQLNETPEQQRKRALADARHQGINRGRAGLPEKNPYEDDAELRDHWAYGFSVGVGNPLPYPASSGVTPKKKRGRPRKTTKTPDDPPVTEPATRSIEPKTPVSPAANPVDFTVDPK